MTVPKLRFKEFDEPWILQSLGEVSDRITTKNKENNQNVLTISAQLGLISQLDYYSKSVAAKNLSGYYLLQSGDFAYNKSYSKGYPMGAIKKLDKYEEGVVSTLYICFRTNYKFLPEFAVQYFETGIHNQQIEQYAKEGARNHGLLNIGVNDFFSTELNLPGYKEQKKIADFLTSVDEKINLLKKKKELLEQYKKGVMQKIFSQELRFKDEKGRDFPEWGEMKLGEVCDYKNGGSFEKYVCEEGLYNLISLNSIDINGKIKPNHKKSTISDGSLQKGDLIMVLSDVAHGNFLGLTDIVPGDNFVLNQRMAALKLKINVDRFYLKTFINKNQSYFKLMGQGSSQLNLSKGDVENFIIKLPSLPEQVKIAQFLSTLDAKINLVETQIQKTELWKKGLLQQMFV